MNYDTMLDLVRRFHGRDRELVAVMARAVADAGAGDFGEAMKASMEVLARWSRGSASLEAVIAEGKRLEARLAVTPRCDAALSACKSVPGAWPTVRRADGSGPVGYWACDVPDGAVFSPASDVLYETNYLCGLTLRKVVDSARLNWHSDDVFCLEKMGKVCALLEAADVFRTCPTAVYHYLPDKRNVAVAEWRFPGLDVEVSATVGVGDEPYWTPREYSETFAHYTHLKVSLCKGWRSRTATDFVNPSALVPSLADLDSYWEGRHFIGKFVPVADMRRLLAAMTEESDRREATT